MRTFTDINDLDYDPELAAALGSMLIAWARAETALLFAFASIMGIKVNFAMLGFYRIPTFEARVKVIRAMIPQWDSDHEHDAIDKVIENLSSLSSTRNGWVHGIWSRETGTDATFVFNIRKAELDRAKPVKAHDVKHHTDCVLRRTAELRALLPMTYDFTPEELAAFDDNKP